jgi:hypothetical protein
MAVGHQDFTQKKPDQLVYLELGLGNGGMLLAVSEDGFRFRAVTPVRANSSLPFAFSLDGRNRLEGEGIVEWVEEEGKTGGLRFTDVSPEFHAVLAAWLNSDSSPDAGREVTPAAAAPLETLEKIRQELRSGYPQRPADATPTARDSGQKSEREGFAHKVPDKNISEKKDPDKNLAEKSFSAQKPKPTIFPPRTEKISDSKESLTANRLFPLSSETASDRETSPTVSSAFLKPPAEERKTPAGPLVAGAKLAPAVPIKRETPFLSTRSVLFGASPEARETQVPAERPAAQSPVGRETVVVPQSRPFVPPLEESLEEAWERAKLTSPPDSPQLSRAAAGSIIALALAVILGALAYNFRQEIGGIFIQLGQSISGENRPVTPAPRQETKPDPTTSEQSNQTTSEPAASEPQNSPAESGNAANPSVGSAVLNPAANRAAPQAKGKAGAAPSASGEVPADAATGQAEFAAARDILRGSNRQRDLSRAVELLWASVKKSHVPAEVTLADLYRRGDGVEKNCDQARVLLLAASKKGSLDGREMLEKILAQGCE